MKIETKNKILDPCDDYLLTLASGNCNGVGAMGVAADLGCWTYECSNSGGTPSCTVASKAVEYTACDDNDGGTTDTSCNADGDCVSKKIFIAFKNLNIYKLVNNNVATTISESCGARQRLHFCCSIGRTDT